MRFQRFFTVAGQDPLKDIVFVKRTSTIRNTDGSVLQEIKDVEVPEQWSQTATDILAQKYFRKAGVPSVRKPVEEEGVPEWLWRRVPIDGANTPTGAETSARQVFERLVGAWTYTGWQLGYFNKTTGQEGVNSEFNAKTFHDELLYILATQKAAPASPQFFNCGIFWAYGVTGEDCGLWYNDGAETKKSKFSFVNPQTMACFIQSIEDNLLGEHGITSLLDRETRVYKFGGGSGSNFSKLRGKGEPLSGGGKSSGLLSWLKIYDVAAGAVKSGGANRRSAKMVIVDCDHPDIEEFVDWKLKEEHKVAALHIGTKILDKHMNAVLSAKGASLPTALQDARNAGVPEVYLDKAQELAKQGYTELLIEPMGLDYEGGAYTTVSGQNANNSIRLTNDFMTAVDNNADWFLHRRTDNKVSKTVKARQLWDQIVSAAWHCADPGVQFDDTINDWHGCINDARIRASNPCCLVGETLVDTSEGLIPIQEIVASSIAGRNLPYVFARDIDSGRPVLRKILRGWESGRVRDLIRVTTDKGLVITSTPEHRFLSFSGGWVRADRLSIGSSLRKIARHINPKRSNRVLISDSGYGGNSTQYQSRWIWEQVYGDIPEGVDVHHLNEDQTDDRISNLELRDKIDHLVYHSTGDKNSRFINCDESDLLSVWIYLENNVNRNEPSKPFTPARWNRVVNKLGLSGKVPVAFSGKNPRIRGMLWEEFCHEMECLRSNANDRVVKIEKIKLGYDVPVYDIEVEGVHNFAVTSDPRRGGHSIIVHNSEYLHIDDSSCNLASINLLAFQTDADFDIAAYKHAITLLTTVLDITVSMAGYPSKEIAENARKYRTLGLGYSNLGALLMVNGLPYDSPDGRNMAACVTAIMHFQASLVSSQLARYLGKFERYDANAAGMIDVAYNHFAALSNARMFRHLQIEPMQIKPADIDISSTNSIINLYEAANRIANDARDAHLRYGLRNAQLTLIMPAGTVGLLMDCATTGVEPDFALVKFKKLAGGGYLKLINQAVPEALKRLGYSAEQVLDITHYATGQCCLNGCPHLTQKLLSKYYPPHAIKDFEDQLSSAMDVRYLLDNWSALELSTTQWQEVNDYVCGTMTVEGAPHLKKEHYAVFACASKCGKIGQQFIAPEGHIDMLAAVQPFLSGAVSKTVNCPSITTIEQVSELFKRGYKKGVKCIAIYRDGSKLSQPLSGSSGIEEQVKVVYEEVKKRRKLPNRRTGYTQKADVGGHRVYLRTGEYEDKTLGEIFIDLHKEGSAFKSFANSFAIAISIGLQYGVPLSEFVDAFTFMRFEPNGAVKGHSRIKMATSMIDYIFRDLAIHYLQRNDLASVVLEEEKKYEPAPTKEGDSVLTEDAEALSIVKRNGYTGDLCRECGSCRVVRTGTCLRCNDCGGNSGCG